MPQYEISIEHTCTVEVTVTADSQDEAESIADNCVEFHSYSNDTVGVESSEEGVEIRDWWVSEGARWTTDPELKWDTCPRCDQDRLHPEEVRNKLCREDNTTYICGPCGTAQALEPYAESPAALGAVVDLIESLKEGEK
jgi:predicted RNA-binding Zn-ribbon protein involved in translation (DUF1610 family)